jgi:glycine/D-amino acid oxidase-like deaminating enzyme
VLTGCSQSVETDATTKSKKSPPVPWLPHHVVSSRTLGTVASTAQVHPGKFTKFFSEKFLSQPNTSLLLGTATALASSNGSVESVLVSPRDGGAETVVPADAVVIAAGPWTGKLAIDLLGKDIGGKLGVEGHRAHSIVLKTKEELTPHCLFTSMTMEDGSMAEPECYTRPDGTTYM